MLCNIARDYMQNCWRLKFQFVIFVFSSPHQFYTYCTCDVIDLFQESFYFPQFSCLNQVKSDFSFLLMWYSFPRQRQHCIRKKRVRKSSVRSLNCGKALFQVLGVSPWILHPQVALSQRFSFKFYISMDKLHINHLCGSCSSWHFSYSPSFDISSSG